MNEFLNLGLAGVVSFGVVGVVTRFVKLTSDVKVALLVVVAFAVGFVPVDLGNDIFNRVKEAVAIGLGVHATWTAIKGGKE